MAYPEVTHPEPIRLALGGGPAPLAGAARSRAEQIWSSLMVVSEKLAVLMQLPFLEMSELIEQLQVIRALSDDQSRTPCDRPLKGSSARIVTQIM